MESINSKNDTKIAKDALIEFFLPILRFVNFFKDISSSKLRDEEIFIKISNIEKVIENNGRFYFECNELVKRVGNDLVNQEILLNKLNNEFSNVRKFIDGESLFSVAFEDKLQLATSNITEIINKTSDLKTRELPHGGTLTNGAAELGLASIEVVLKGIIKNSKSKPYLFGVNKGGNFLASYLAHRIDLHEKFLVKCDYRVDFDRVMNCEKRVIFDEPVVIIDDVTRSGKTLGRVKSHLQKMYPNSNIFTIVLVTVCPEAEVDFKLPMNVDYSPWFTRNSDVSLPWSRSASATIESEVYFDDIEMDQIASRLQIDNNN